MSTHPASPTSLRRRFEPTPALHLPAYLLVFAWVGIAALPSPAGAWNPNPNSAVAAVASTGNAFYVGGSFTTVLGTPRPRFAGFLEGVVAVDEPVENGRSLMLRAAPNPSRADVALEVILPETAVAEMSVYDLAGRLVRRLQRGAFPAGVTRLPWDGRDDERRILEAGLYFVRLHVGAQQLTAKVLRLQ